MSCPHDELLDSRNVADEVWEIMYLQELTAVYEASVGRGMGGGVGVEVRLVLIFIIRCVFHLAQRI